jgi:hypothetical protein
LLSQEEARTGRTAGQQQGKKKQSADHGHSVTVSEQLEV